MMKSSSPLIALLIAATFTCSTAWADKEEDPIGNLIRVQTLLSTPESNSPPPSSSSGNPINSVQTNAVEVRHTNPPVESIEVAAIDFRKNDIANRPAVSSSQEGRISTQPVKSDIDPLSTLLNDNNILAPEGRRQLIADAALNYLNIPYQYGGNSAATGFDCSGFVRVLYLQVTGKSLPRRTSEQASAITKINRSQLQPGDLVFFNTARRTYSHVGIYVGNNKFIHAPRTGSNIRMEDMTARYWNSRFTGARRVELR